MSKLWTPSGGNGQVLTSEQKAALISRDGLLAYVEQLIVKARQEDRYKRWPDVVVHDQETANKLALAFSRRPVKGCPIRVDPTVVEKPNRVRVFTRDDMR